MWTYAPRAVQGWHPSASQITIVSVSFSCLHWCDACTGLMFVMQYDAMDLCLMAASMCIFVWVAGAMYVLYAHMYYSHMQW